MYSKFFGFTEEPFNLTPDPDFLFLSATHKEGLSSMTSTIRKRLGTMTLTGELGTGKTTLIHTLLKTLDKEVKPAFIFNPRIGLEDLLKSILIDLGVPVPEPKLDALFKAFNLYLQERLLKNETVALIIDEAQEMDLEVLEGVSRLAKRETPASGLLQIILVGQPELDKNLDSPTLQEFKKRIAVRRKLSPLAPAETKRYIDHRLRIAGSSSLRVFSAPAVELICKYSGGIPRVINQLCDHSFLMGYSLSTPKIDVKIIKDVMKSNPHWRSRRWPGFPKITPLRFLISSCGLVALFLGAIYILSPDWNFNPASQESRVYKVKISQSQVSAKTSPAIDSTLKEPAFRLARMQQGWSLSSLAKRYYPSMHLTFQDFILQANPQITDANVIHLDDEIRIPEVTEETLLLSAPDRTYQIHLGTFNSPKFLKDFENQPVLKGKKLEVVPRKVSTEEIWYRFIAGSFAHRQEALEAIRILKGKGLLPAFPG